jgi:hypothetical protein
LFLSSIYLYILYLNKSKKHDIRTIIHIPDDRWNEIRNILSEKKSRNDNRTPVNSIKDGIR